MYTAPHSKFIGMVNAVAQIARRLSSQKAAAAGHLKEVTTVECHILGLDDRRWVGSTGCSNYGRLGLAKKLKKNTANFLYIKLPLNPKNIALDVTVQLAIQYIDIEYSSLYFEYFKI